jgi:hypothetical protein
MTDRSAGWSTPDSGAPAVAPDAPPTPGRYDAPAAVPRGLLPLRPMATGEILDGVVAVTRAFPRTVLAFGAAIAVVSAVLDLGITLTIVGPVETNGDPSAVAEDLLSAGAVATGLNLLVGLVTQAVMAGVMTAVVGRAVMGTGTTTAQAWAEVRPLLPRLLGLSLLVGFAVYGAVVAAVVALVLLAQLGAGGALLGLLVLSVAGAGAVWLYTRWALAPAVLVLEKQRVRASLRRSAALSRRAFWRLLGILLLAVTIAVVVSLVVQLPFQLLGYNPFAGLDQDYVLTTRDAVLGAVSGAVATTLVAPFAAGVRALLYVDRRMRAEGLDVALVAARQVR